MGAKVDPQVTAELNAIRGMLKSANDYIRKNNQTIETGVDKQSKQLLDLLNATKKSLAQAKTDLNKDQADIGKQARQLAELQKQKK